MAAANGVRESHWFVLPTTPRRNHESPAELIFGIKPDVTSFEASGTIVVHEEPIEGKVVPGMTDSQLDGEVVEDSTSTPARPFFVPGGGSGSSRGLEGRRSHGSST